MDTSLDLLVVVYTTRRQPRITQQQQELREAGVRRIGVHSAIASRAATLR